MITLKKVFKNKPVKPRWWNEEVKRSLKRVEAGVLADYQKTVATWTDKPEFESKIKSTIKGASLTIWTDDKIYEYVDLGTKPHKIRAKTAKGLVFLVGGEPKTEPDIIISVPGKPGTLWRRKMEVDHPGTKARNFSKIINKSWRKEFQEEMRAAVVRFSARIRAK